MAAVVAIHCSSHVFMLIGSSKGIQKLIKVGIFLSKKLLQLGDRR